MKTTRLRPALVLASIFVVTFAFSAACAAQDVPLIPRKVIDSPSEHDYLTISPDGKTIAYTAPSDKGVANVWVEDLATHQKRMVTKATQRSEERRVGKECRS